MFAPKKIIDILACHFIRSRQSAIEQTIVVDLGRNFKESNQDTPICNLRPTPNGTGVTFVNADVADSEQLSTLSALLSLGCFTSILIVSTGPQCNQSHIEEIIDLTRKYKISCITAIDKAWAGKTSMFDASIVVTDVVDLIQSDGSAFGARVDGVTTLFGSPEVSRNFATLVQNDLDIHVPFDMVAAGLVAGVLEQAEDGTITSNGKVFTQSFGEAVQRLERIDIQARLKNAILFARAST